MRILQIVHAFPPESVAGTERYCEALSRELLRLGHDCLVLAGSERSVSQATLETVEHDGLAVSRYLRAGGPPRRWTAEYDPDAERFVRQLLALTRPDVVHLHHWQRLTNNLVAICADAGVPVVVTLHDAWTTCPRIHRIRSDGAFCAEPPSTAPCATCAERAPWQDDAVIASALGLRREIVRAELALAAAVVVPSEAHRAFLLGLLDLPDDRLAVVPHGNLSRSLARAPAAGHARFPDRPLQIGHWGYLVYLKGPHLILEAVHRLRDPSAVQVHLIGTAVEQDYERRLRELAEGIAVRFHGAYGPDDLGSLDLDLAVLPSIASESYSFALDEALQLGLPVLVSDRGAPRERIGAAGLTFRAGDAADLAERLQALIDTPKTLDRLRQGVRADLLFSIDAHAAMLEKFYQDAVHAGAPPRVPRTPYVKLLAHAGQEVRAREEALAGLQARLAGAELALHEKDVRFHQVLHEKDEKEAIILETRRDLETSRAEHATLAGRLRALGDLPLVRLHHALHALADLPGTLLARAGRALSGTRPSPLPGWRVWARRSPSLTLVRVVLGKGRRKLFSREALSARSWRVWMRKCAEEYARLREDRLADAGPSGAGGLTAYGVHVRNNRVTPWLRTVLARAARELPYRPRFSVIMPVYNVEPTWLKAAVDSVRCQIYPEWELCIADDASTRPDLLAYLRGLARDRRITVCFRPENGHISAASNSAAALAGGEYLVLMDHDDLLAPNALFELARLLQAHPDADLIYTDEDKIDEQERRYDPQFKPDWSPEMLLAYNYVNHVTCIRRELFERVGGFRVGYEGSQDYDLLLRAVSETDRVHHVPKVLYHWRALRASTASAPEVKPIVRTSGRAALEDHLARLGVPATPYTPEFAERLHLPVHQLDWPDTGPSVAIIIPTRDQGEVLRTCVESILARTTYGAYRVVVVDNDSSEPGTLAYLEELAGRGVEVMRISNDGRPFSFSRVNNLAVQRVEEELVLFLNDDTEVIEPKWLSRMVGYLGLPGVGATGARLILRDGTLQHAGVVLGLQNGVAPGHAFFGHPAEQVSYYFQAEIARPCAAVTAACLLTPRRLFLDLGGFDEKRYAVSMNDVDYGLRVAQRGLRVVYVGGAELFHYESRTRSRRDDPAELAHFRRAYGHLPDRYYNPNLSNVRTYEIDTACHLDYEPCLGRPVRALMATHNLNLEGATRSLYELAAGLKRGGRVQPIALSPVGGVGERWYREAGVEVRIQALPNCENVLEGWSSKADYEAAIERVVHVIDAEQPDVVVANTVNGFYVVDAATRAGVPCVWIIRESYAPDELRRAINTFALPTCERAFADAYRVVFVSTDTMRLYSRYNGGHNFVVVHNGLDAARIDAFASRVSRAEAARTVQAPPGKKIITTVGTICERKDQRTLAEAVAVLSRRRGDFHCYMVGLREGIAYADRLRRMIRDHRLDDVISLVPETEDIYPYLRAADVFAFTSHVEGFSRTVLEAEAFGLPIVTTPCGGIYEQVRAEVNALLFHMSDAAGLARHLAALLDDGQKRAWMGRNSRKVFEYLQTYDEMVGRYERVISGAWMRGPLEP
jgi:glycosyltransferase involved in cell wall biosynthesis/GT2 family glycosyltransferase